MWPGDVFARVCPLHALTFESILSRNFNVGLQNIKVRVTVSVLFGSLNLQNIWVKMKFTAANKTNKRTFAGDMHRQFCCG